MPAPPSEQAPAADAPAAPAREPRGRQILEQAKVELKEAQSAAASPAGDKAPEPAAAPEPGPDEHSEAPASDKDEQRGSRREQGQRLREQIRKELLAEFEAEQRATQQRNQNEQQAREFDELVQRADAGDWEAKDRVLALLKSNRGMQTAIAQGRNSVLEELGRDINVAVYKIDGLDEDGQQALLKAPSVADFGKAAFEQGRKTEKAVHEGTIATLKAENESLKGRLAGNSPSPTGSNGQASTSRPPTRFKSMHDAFAAAQAELGYAGRGS
jgi:hypothetical protein